jgi:hypothetical protein
MKKKNIEIKVQRVAIKEWLQDKSQTIGREVNKLLDQEEHKSLRLLTEKDELYLIEYSENVPFKDGKGFFINQKAYLTDLTSFEDITFIWTENNLEGCMYEEVAEYDDRINNILSECLFGVGYDGVSAELVKRKQDLHDALSIRALTPSEMKKPLKNEEDLILRLRLIGTQKVIEDAKENGNPAVNPFNSLEEIRRIFSLMLQSEGIIKGIPVVGELRDRLELIESQNLIYDPSVLDLLSLKVYRVLASEIYRNICRELRSELFDYYFKFFQKEGRMLSKKETKIFLRLASLLKREKYNKWYQKEKPTFLPENPDSDDTIFW